MLNHGSVSTVGTGWGRANINYRIEISPQKLFAHNAAYTNRVKNLMQEALNKTASVVRSSLNAKLGSAYKNHKIFNTGSKGIVFVDTDEDVLRAKGASRGATKLRGVAGIDITINAQRANASKRWAGALYTQEHGETTEGKQTITPKRGKWLAIPQEAGKSKMRNAPLGFKTSTLFPNATWKPFSEGKDGRVLVDSGGRILARAVRSVRTPRKGKEIIYKTVMNALEDIPGALNRVSKAHGIQWKLGNSDVFTTQMIDMSDRRFYANTWGSVIGTRR
jgi:hypothetical protein